MLKDFKNFVMRGNVLDLAVAVIIGGAFGKIVTSMVNDILMPLIGLLLGAVNFSGLQIVLKPAVGDTPASTLNYGTFIQNIVDFLIIAICIFTIIKVLEKFKRKEEQTPPPAPTISDEVKLLTEIRDLLNENKR